MDTPDKRFLKAAQAGDLDEAKRLLAESPAVVRARSTTKGYTALHFAAMGGAIPVVEWLLEQGFDVMTEAPGGVTPLAVALEYKRFNTVRRLQQLRDAQARQHGLREEAWQHVEPGRPGGSAAARRSPPQPAAARRGPQQHATARHRLPPLATAAALLPYPKPKPKPKPYPKPNPYPYPKPKPSPQSEPQPHLEEGELEADVHLARGEGVEALDLVREQWHLPGGSKHGAPAWDGGAEGGYGGTGVRG